MSFNKGSVIQRGIELKIWGLVISKDTRLCAKNINIT